MKSILRFSFFLFTILMISIPAYADVCGFLHPLSSEKAEECREAAIERSERKAKAAELEEERGREREEELQQAKEDRQERREEAKEKRSTQRSSNDDTINFNLPGSFLGAGQSDKKIKHPRESKFEVGFNIPLNFIFPFQQGAPGYMLSTQISQLRFQYNFSEYMHFGVSYIDQKIDAESFKDTDAGYYENKHYIGYAGARGWLRENEQVTVNIGFTESESFPEGETAPEYEMGLFVEMQYMFVFDSLKVGPALTVIIASARDAEYRYQNQKASFIRFGVNATIGLPFGYVGDW